MVKLLMMTLRNLKRLKFKYLFILLMIINSKVFSYEVFSTEEFFDFFLKSKVSSSVNIDIVTMSLDEEILNFFDQKSQNINIYCHYFDKTYIKKFENIKFHKIKTQGGYLHQKYMILDNSSIILGTGNLTKSGIYQDINHYIYTDNEKIVEIFKKEIQNINLDFKTYKKVLNLENEEIIFLNFPSEENFNYIRKLINNAQKSIKIFTFSFTDPLLTYDIQLKSSENIEIKILSDDWNKENDSPLKYMSGVKIKYLKNLHSKIIIIDDNYLIFGSFNHTYRARKKNYEYVLIFDSEYLIKYFDEQFEYYYNRGVEL
ncbi:MULTISPECIES: phospholipase D-like domain-containing protein [Oceanotoga]|nr:MULTISPECIES: phospholipase D-like domain-containing protein [Oceanotoga]